MNSEGIPSPTGRHWNASTINGSPKRASGILHNPLYIGEIHYNRQSFIKDPDTGKRQSRTNKKADIVKTDVPELEIISKDLWALAHKQIRKRSIQTEGGEKSAVRQEAQTFAVRTGSV